MCYMVVAYCSTPTRKSAGKARIFMTSPTETIEGKRRLRHQHFFLVTYGHAFIDTFDFFVGQAIWNPPCDVPLAATS